MSLPVNQLLLGDSREVLRGLPDASIDSLVTDPPAGVNFMNKDWDDPDQIGSDTKAPREAFVSFLREVLQESFRVLKPGGHILVWSLPRTSHWTALAIEEAGFEIRDALHHAKDRTPDIAAFLASLTDEQRELLVRAQESTNVMAHLFGSGFPKSFNISKALDKMAGATRRVLRPGIGYDPDRHVSNQFTSIMRSNVGVNTAAFKSRIGEVTEPATPEARQWDGWGTALKPAVEVWWLARKPIEAKTTVQQVLATGTGAINIDGTRIGVGSDPQAEDDSYQPSSGRWPANLILTHGPGCKKVGIRTLPAPTINRFTDGMKPFGNGANHPYEVIGGGEEQQDIYECEDSCAVKALDRQSGTLVSGGASRFFATFEPDAPFRYATKASMSDKNADLDDGLKNHHPTVKGQGLMTYLVRLITPPNGIVLDPFAGSGSTLVAAVTEGFRFIGIEREPEYHQIACQRVGKALARRQELENQQAVFGVMEELPQE